MTWKSGVIAVSLLVACGGSDDFQQPVPLDRILSGLMVIETFSTD
jgi:hypothetical protein